MWPFGQFFNIWGYVDGKGREYAIIGASPARRSLISANLPSRYCFIHIPGVISSWREIKSWKDHLYVVADRGADGVLIINMAQAPDKIRLFILETLLSPLAALH